jgi:hypothetical protein
MELPEARGKLLNVLAARAGSLAKIEETIAAARRTIKLATTPMNPRYRGEHLPDNRIWFGGQVKYLTEGERNAYKLHFRDGLIYDANGKLFDTNKSPLRRNAIFVLDKEGNFYATTDHAPGKFHHSSFLAGGEVAAAGEFQVKDGVLTFMSDRTGHYAPPGLNPGLRYTEQAKMYLDFYGVDMSTVKFDIRAKTWESQW